MKNRQYSLLLCVLIACLLSCDKVDGPEPDTGNIPQATAKLLTDGYPNARNVVFKTIQANELWEARFEEGQVQYYMGLQPDKIVAVHKLLADTVPDSMQQIIRKQFSIARNAILSDYREQKQLDPDAEATWYRAKMTVDGQEFSIRWAYRYVYNSPVKQVSFAFGEHNIFEFDTDPRYEQIPSTLVDLQNRTDYFVTSLTTKVIGENKINYYFNGKEGGSPRIITNDGVMIGSYNFVRQINSLAESPEPIRKEMNRFGVDEKYEFSVFSGECFEENIKSYSILVYGSFPGYRFFFDQDGKLTTFFSDAVYEYR